MSILIAILVFGLLILIHEGGHFLFARLFRVTVNEFAIGMGPKIFSRTSKKTGIAYSLRLLPFGGFVSMAGEDEESDDPNAFSKKPVWQRIIITAAGAAMNILVGILAMGILVASSDALASTVVYRFRSLLPEDEIVAVEGVPADSDGEIAYALLLGRQNPVSLTLERDGGIVAFEAYLPREGVSFGEQTELLPSDRITAVNGTAVSTTGEMIAALLPAESAVNLTVRRAGHESEFVLEDMTAPMLTGGSAGGGLRENDRILAVEGVKVHSANELVYEVMRRGIEPVDVTVLRDGETLRLEGVMFPTAVEAGETLGMVDFIVYREAKTPLNVLKHGFFRSVSTIKMIWESLYDLITGRYGVESVSGPVGVTQAMGEAVSSGLSDLVYLAVVISMNLGVMNLLPLPALDGGRLVFQIIEGIRRKPVSRQLEAYIHFGGIVVLMILMVLITFKDIVGLFR